MIDDSILKHFLYSAKMLQAKIGYLRAFDQNIPMVCKATISKDAWNSIDNFLTKEKKIFLTESQKFIFGLENSSMNCLTPNIIQRKLVSLKVKFNSLLTVYDVVSDALNQRSEFLFGTLLSGVDQLAIDALNVDIPNYKIPPLISYTDRGWGGAIRRVNVKIGRWLKSPCSFIRIPRERFLSATSLAASVLHESYHQLTANCDLNSYYSELLQKVILQNKVNRTSWNYFRNCISEILPDILSLARLGVAESLGLISIMSLPRYMVFNINLKDRHPFPFFRVLLNLEAGRILYPSQQWDELEKLWFDLYPIEKITADKIHFVTILKLDCRNFLELILNHKCKNLNFNSLADLFPIDSLQPVNLCRIGRQILWSNKIPKNFNPCIAFASMGQLKFNGQINPESEVKLLEDYLTSISDFNKGDTRNKSLENFKIFKKKFV